MLLSLFDIMYEPKKITKPIRLIQLFAGYGSQKLAFDYLGVKVEDYKISEWAIKSIQAYKELHYTNETYECNLSKEELIEYFKNHCISINYNDPLTENQLKRMPLDKLRDIYSNMQITHNLGSICNIKGKDLEIVETDKYEYMLTYSFPCQDLSLAGDRKLMDDTTTRSGMLWEVQRILKEISSGGGNLPQILLMENVPQVHGLGAVEKFNEWITYLDTLGYKSYFEDLNAKDYGIPQNRDRCFMVSLLGDYSYNFPNPEPLKLRLKDLLEENVDEKYYLSQKTINQISKWKAQQDPLKDVDKEKEVSPTLTARGAGEMHSGMVLIGEEYKGTYNYAKSDKFAHDKRYKEDNDLSECLLSTGNQAGVVIKIKNATKKGYLEAEDGDGVDISGRMEYHRGTVQKGLAQTLSTMGGENIGVVVETENYYQYKQKGHLDLDCRIYKEEKIAPTTTTPKTKILNNLRIRKLTPKECFRLMGVKDEDFKKIKQSDASLYHLAGDSIVVNVLMKIYERML